MNVATLKKNAGNSYFGLAIGGTVMAGAFAVGGTVCSGAFNPAVEIGLACMKFTPWGNSWMTILANLLGGAAAAGCFYLIHPKADRD